MAIKIILPGRVSILLTDAPAAVYDSVVITFAEISAHINSEWVTIKGDTTSIDLLQWTNGKYMVLAEDDIPVGKYTQIRIKIIEAHISVDGQVYELGVPSAAKTGLKLVHQFTISSGSGYELAVDFDANRSVVRMGSSKNPKGYKLKPTLRIIATSIAGSISGNVTKPQDIPLACAVSGADTLTSTYVDSIDGAFMLAFLPQGSYTVSVEDTTGKTFNKTDVMVTAGVDNVLGVITLE